MFSQAKVSSGFSFFFGNNARYIKINSRKGKKSCTPNDPPNISIKSQNKFIHSKTFFFSKKIQAARKFLSLPITFLMVLPKIIEFDALGDSTAPCKALVSKSPEQTKKSRKITSP